MKKLLKKVIPLSLSLLMVGTNVFGKDIIVNGFKQYKDIEVVNNVELMKNDTLLNAMGVHHRFDVDSQSVIILHNDSEIILKRGSNIAVVNGEDVEMGVAPQAVSNTGFNNGLYIPVEFVASQLDAISVNDDEKIQINIDTLSLIEPNLYGVTDETIRYTYKEAVDKAIKNTNDIRSIKNSIATHEYNKENVEMGIDTYQWSGLVGGTLDNQYIDYISTARMLTDLIELEGDQIRLTELSLERSVLTALIDIEKIKDNINLLEENINVLEQTYKNNLILNELGMLSNSDLNTSKKTLDDTKSNLEMLKLNLQTNKNTLNNVMGVSLSEDNYIDFDMNMEPITLDIEAYARHSANNSVTVEQLRANQRKTGYDYDNYLGAGQVNYQEGRDEKLRTAQNISMQINDIINSHELAIKQLYISSQQVLGNHDKLVSDYENAIEDYNKAILNYELGYITQLQVDSAKMNVQSKLNAVRENVLNYENLRFMILNPDLILV